MSSTPAGSIEAQARVQVLGELLEELEGVVGSEGLEVWWGEGRRAWSLCMLLAGSILPILPFPLYTKSEKLKFTPPPRPQQCMEFDKEATVACSATGREKPTIKWIRAGGYQKGRAEGPSRAVP